MEAVYNVKLNTKDSVKNAKDLGKTIDGLNTQLEEMEENGEKGTEQFKELEAAVESLTEQERKLLGDMEHLAKTIKVEVSGSISKMEDRLYELALAGETSSEEFKELQKQTAEYKRVIIETDKSVDALAEQGRGLSNALSLASGVTAGFQAYTGVTALAGTENENLLETITKLEAAQGVLNAIETIKQQIQGKSIALTNFQAKANLFLDKVQRKSAKSTVLQSVATNGAAVAQRVLNIVMAANPFLILIAGIGILIGLFAIFGGAAQDNKDKQEALADSIEETNASLERQNKILDEINAQAQKRLDNTNKLIDGEIKYLQAIKNRTAEEEDSLNKKLGEKRANDIKKIELSIDTAEKKTKSFGKSFKQQFDAIDLAIKGTDIEDGVNDINYSEVRRQVNSFEKDLIRVSNLDIAPDAKLKRLQNLNSRYTNLSKNLKTYNRRLGEAEKEEFQGTIDGFKEIGSLLDNNRAALIEYNGLIQDKGNVVELNKQADALKDLQQVQAEEAEAEKKRDENRKIYQERQKKAEQERKKLIEDNISFAQRAEDIRISLIEDSTERELAVLDTKFEREMAKITSQSEEANALRAELFNQFVAEETAIQDKIDLAKKNSAIALERELAEISRTLRLSDTELELNELQASQTLELEKLREGLELELLTQVEFDELRLIQIADYEARKQEIEDEARAEQDAKIQASHDTRMALLSEGLGFASSVAGGLTNLSKVVTETQVNNAEGNEKQQEKIRKKGFERNKKLQIASATIAGIQGVINALTAPSVVPEPFGSILKGVTAGIIGATTIANIDKIKSTKFNGGGGKGTTGGVGSGGGSAGAGAAQLGPRNLSDIRTNLNPDGTPADGPGDTPQPALIAVLESDITDTQEAVAKADVRSTY